MAGRGKAIDFEYGPALEMLRKAISKDATPLVKNAFRRASLEYAREVRDDLRAATPVLTGNLRRATKHKSTQGGGAKVFVDKSGGGSGRGYHWHLLERGTKARRTKKGASRGAMPAQPYINAITDRAALAFVSQIVPKLIAQVRRKLEGNAK